jgi:hypothetical protein
MGVLWSNLALFGVKRKVQFHNKLPVSWARVENEKKTSVRLNKKNPRNP